jgi:hypothetical protein
MLSTILPNFNFKNPEMFRYRVMGIECLTIIWPCGYSEYLFGDSTRWKQTIINNEININLRNSFHCGYMGAEFLGEIK